MPAYVVDPCGGVSLINGRIFWVQRSDVMALTEVVLPRGDYELALVSYGLKKGRETRTQVCSSIRCGFTVLSISFHRSMRSVSERYR